MRPRGHENVATVLVEPSILRDFELDLMARDFRVWVVSTVATFPDPQRLAFQLRRSLVEANNNAWADAADWTLVWVTFGENWLDGEEAEHPDDAPGQRGPAHHPGRHVVRRAREPDRDDHLEDDRHQDEDGDDAVPEPDHHARRLLFVQQAPLLIVPAQPLSCGTDSFGTPPRPRW